MYLSLKLANSACFCNACLYEIQGRMNVLTTQQSKTYQRYQPETTLVYRLFEHYYPEFTEYLVEQDKYCFSTSLNRSNPYTLFSLLESLNTLDKVIKILESSTVIALTESLPVLFNNHVPSV